MPPTPPRQGEAAQRSSTNWVQGDNNNVAGGDINTEIGKAEINVFGSEIVQEFARARKRERAGRGIQDPEALQRLADKYVAPDKLLESSEGGQTGFPNPQKPQNPSALGQRACWWAVRCGVSARLRTE